MAPIGPPILSIEAAGGFSLVLCSLISCDSVPWPGQHYDLVYHYSDSWKSSDIEAMWLTYLSDNLKSKKHWRIKLVHSNNGGLYIEAQRAKGPVGLGDWKPKPFFLFHLALDAQPARLDSVTGWLNSSICVYAGTRASVLVAQRRANSSWNLAATLPGAPNLPGPSQSTNFLHLNYPPNICKSAPIVRKAQHDLVNWEIVD